MDLLEARSDKEHISDQRGVAEVIAPFIGHDPFDACFGGGSDERRFLIWGCRNGHGNDEDILTMEGGNNRGVGGVVYILGGDPGRKDVGAFCARESGHSMFAVCEESGNNIRAEVSSSLRRSA